MDDYLCLSLLSWPGEPEAEFKARLSAFWTRMLRERPAEFEKVYAEAAAFDRQDAQLVRRYLVEADGIEALTGELTAAGMGFVPPDGDDVYSKYEAAPPEWFWIEH